jgi:hypothetical protein
METNINGVRADLARIDTSVARNENNINVNRADLVKIDKKVEITQTNEKIKNLEAQTNEKIKNLDILTKTLETKVSSLLLKVETDSRLIQESSNVVRSIASGVSKKKSFKKF